MSQRLLETVAEWFDLFPVEKAERVLEINASVSAGWESVSGACERVGVDRSTYYRWRERVARYDAGDDGAIEARSSSPKKHGRQTSDRVRAEVVRLAKSQRFPSPTAIARHLSGGGTRIHPGTVISIVEDAGLYGYVIKTRSNGEKAKVRGWL